MGCPWRFITNTVHGLPADLRALKSVDFLGAVRGLYMDCPWNVLDCSWAVGDVLVGPLWDIFGLLLPWDALGDSSKDNHPLTGVHKRRAQFFRICFLKWREPPGVEFSLNQPV